MAALKRVGLIRHFPVAHPFLKGFVSQTQVMDWFEGYNQADVQQLQVSLQGPWDICYTSELRRARDTAAAIFTGPVISSALLNEPFPDPLFRGNPRLPFLVWAMLLRLSLVHNHVSQSQRQEVLERKAANFLRALREREEPHVLVVSHAFTMEILSRLLVKEGFTGKKLKRPPNGVLYVYEQ